MERVEEIVRNFTCRKCRAMEAIVTKRMFELLSRVLVEGYKCEKVKEKGIRKVLCALGLVSKRYIVVGELARSNTLVIKKYKRLTIDSLRE